MSMEEQLRLRARLIIAFEQAEKKLRSTLAPLFVDFDAAKVDYEHFKLIADQLFAVDSKILELTLHGDDFSPPKLKKVTDDARKYKEIWQGLNSRFDQRVGS